MRGENRCLENPCLVQEFQSKAQELVPQECQTIIEAKREQTAALVTILAFMA